MSEGTKKNKCNWPCGHSTEKKDQTNCSCCTQDSKNTTNAITAARIYRYINLLSLSAVYLGVQVVGMMHSPASNFRFTSKTLIIKSSANRI